MHNFTRSDEEGGNGENVYMEAIRSMCNNNEQSFEVFYSDLAMFDEFTSRVTEFLTEHPDIVLDILNEVLFLAVFLMFRAPNASFFPNFPTTKKFTRTFTCDSATSPCWRAFATSVPRR